MGKRIVLITGANKGIGFGIAKHLGLNGWQVIIGARHEQRASEAISRLESLGIDVAGWVDIELTDLANIDKAAKEVSEKYPELSLLVNNAGIRADNVMFMMADEQWHNVVNTSLDGFFYITRRLLKHMMPRKRGGRIINVASLSGVKGMPGQTNYSAAKAGLIGATKALAQEVAARGVTVNAVAPGFIETDMTRDLPQEELKKMVPAQRFGKPEEVAALVAFLASDEAAYITGEVININGGLYT
jgi:3-oxoacyl-[acyl-carrier protein] reductase